MKAHLTLIFALLLICSGIAVAQTPDLLTPSEETICDTETGAAFGLCNAYCEAMDCDSATPQASATACTKVKDKFANITGRTALPCETCPPPPPGTVCPCSAEIETYNVLLSLPGTCEAYGEITVKRTAEGVIGATCFLPETGPGGFCGVESAYGDQYMFITPQEGAACAQAILASCNPE